MPAYVISEVEILDEGAAGHYRRFAAASIAEYGGRYLVRGAAGDVTEGASTTRRFVVVEFPSMKRAREWYASNSYALALRFRAAALDRRLVFVDGVAETSGG